METFLIIIGLLLTAPYLIFVWLFGLTLAKRLFDKEWKTAKGLLGTYEKLTPEERMGLEVKEISKKTQWVTAPTAKEEERIKNETAFKEGLVDNPPVGGWETPEVINSRPNP